MCCHRVISLLQSALSPARRRRVQDDDSTTANDVHRPQQVVLITDEVEERGMPMVLHHRFIESTHAYIIMSMARRLRQPTPAPITHRAIIDRRRHKQGLVVEAGCC